MESSVTMVGGKFCVFKIFKKISSFLFHRVLTYADQPQEQRYDPMVYVFPRVTKCIFHKYGKKLFDLIKIELKVIDINEGWFTGI